jgi:hypothetical protein
MTLATPDEALMEAANIRCKDKDSFCKDYKRATTHNQLKLTTNSNLKFNNCESQLPKPHIPTHRQIHLGNCSIGIIWHPPNTYTYYFEFISGVSMRPCVFV